MLRPSLEIMRHFTCRRPVANYYGKAVSGQHNAKSFQVVIPRPCHGGQAEEAYPGCGHGLISVLLYLFRLYAVTVNEIQAFCDESYTI